MDYIEREPAPPFRLPKCLAGEWYLKGYEDAFSARQAITPIGPAGDQYKKGYDEGLAAAQREFFAAICY